MLVDEARELLDEIGFEGRQVTPILGGWASWTFDVDGAWILRVARDEEITAAQHRELRLLPALGPAVSFAVPVIERSGLWQGRAFMVYRRITGRELEATDHVADLAPLLGELHRFPVERAAELLGCDAVGAVWRERYEELRGEIDSLVMPLLDGELRAALGARYDQFMDELQAFTPSLVHADLGTVHILVDPDTRRPVGLIDFETATIGDPAVDFVGLLCTLGEQATRQIVEAYPGSIAWDRLLFYWQVAPAYDVVYGLAQKDDGIVKDGIDGLRRRVTMRR